MQPAKRSIRYFPLLAVLLILGGAIAAFPESSIFSFEYLKENREHLMAFVKKHEILSPIAYISIYALATLLSLPSGAFLSVAGGFLFPQPCCTAYAAAGATLGASLLFLAAKTAFSSRMKEMLGKAEGSSFQQQLRLHFEEDAASYLLFLRLVPIFPFWVVNLAPAFFKIPFFTFFWTTLLGIIPAAFVFTQAGVGLGAIFDAGNTLDLSSIFNKEVKISLIALGTFALIPVFVKKFKIKI